MVRAGYRRGRMLPPLRAEWLWQQRSSMAAFLGVEGMWRQWQRSLQRAVQGVPLQHPACGRPIVGPNGSIFCPTNRKLFVPGAVCPTCEVDTGCQVNAVSMMFGTKIAPSHRVFTHMQKGVYRNIRDIERKRFAGRLDCKQCYNRPWPQDEDDDFCPCSSSTVKFIRARDQDGQLRYYVRKTLYQGNSGVKFREFLEKLKESPIVVLLYLYGQLENTDRDGHALLLWHSGTEFKVVDSFGIDNLFERLNDDEALSTCFSARQVSNLN